MAEPVGASLIDTIVADIRAERPGILIKMRAHRSGSGEWTARVAVGFVGGTCPEWCDSGESRSAAIENALTNAARYWSRSANGPTGV